MNNLKDSKYLIRDCPNCGASKDLSKLGITSSRPLEKISWEESIKYFVGFRFKQPFFTYRKCKKCKLLYCPIYFNQEQLNFLYKSMPDNLAGESLEVVGKTQKNYVSYLSKNNNEVTMLEIGSDIGIVSSEFSKKYVTKLIAAIEPNLEVHKKLENNIKSSSNAKLHIYQHLEELENNKMFDYIIGVHVFDHLIEPIEYLKSLRLKLVQGGEILLIVHNEASILRYFLGKKWPPFCPQHPHLFSPKTITSILEKIGYRDIKVIKTTNWFSLRHVVKLLGTILGLKLDFRILDKIQLPLKLGNMAVVAKNIK